MELDSWINNFEKIASQKISQSGGSATAFKPGYAAMIGEAVSNAVNSQGNPFAKALVSIIITVLAVVIVFAIIAVILYLSVRSRIEEIQGSWSKNRCKLNIIPIAPWVGPPGTTLGGNAKECAEDFLGKYLEQKFKPLFTLFSKIFGILNVLTQSLQKVRIMIFTIRQTIMKMAQDVYKKLKDVYYRIAYLVKRVMQIIIYIFLTFRNVFYVLRYTVQTLQSITNFWLFRMCFHPTQRIPTIKNKETLMNDLQIGDFVNPSSKKPNRVLGIWRFKSQPISKWVQPGETSWMTSPGHYVWDKQESKWIHEDSNIILTDSQPQICPWTESGLLQNHQQEIAMDYWGPGTSFFELNIYRNALQRHQGQLVYNEDKLDRSFKYRWSSMCVVPKGTLIQNIPIEEIQLNDSIIGICSADSSIFEWRQIHSKLVVSSGTWIQKGDKWVSATEYPIVPAPTSTCYTIATTSGTIELEGMIIKDGLGWHTAEDDAKHYAMLAREV